MERERRRAPRRRKRLKVDYGETDFSTGGLILDLSAGGIFVTSNKVLPVGTRLHLKITAGSSEVYAEGRVARRKLVPATLRGVEPQGMGIRILETHQIIEGLLGAPQPARAARPLGVTCSTPTALEALIREQLSRGVVVVSVADPPPALQATVEFDVMLEFLPDAPLFVGEGRVVQVLDAIVGRTERAAVLEVVEATNFIKALRGADT